MILIKPKEKLLAVLRINSIKAMQGQGLGMSLGYGALA